MACSGRDLRLDLLRGLCLLKMVFNHLWKTPLHQYQALLGNVSAAAGFFLISGAVVGIVHGRRMHSNGLAHTSRAVLTRAMNLYIANLGLVLLFASLHKVGYLQVKELAELWTEEGFRWYLLFTLDQPCYLQVLPRYVVYLALTPIALWLLKTGRSHWLVLSTLAIWVLNQVLPGDGLRIPFLESTTLVSFRIAAWQLLFFSGMVLGYHREAIGRWWGRLPARWTVSLLAMATVGFSLLRNYPDLLDIGPRLTHTLLGRADLGPLRVLNLVVFFALIFLLTDRLWKPIHRATGWLLLPFGQSSLYLFLLHIVVVWLIPPLLEFAGVWYLIGAWQRLPLDLLMIALLWLLIDRRFLFDYVPR
jgi:hypothetical protein